jgi:hypothetical protein
MVNFKGLGATLLAKELAERKSEIAATFFRSAKSPKL